MDDIGGQGGLNLNQSDFWNCKKKIKHFKNKLKNR